MANAFLYASQACINQFFRQNSIPHSILLLLLSFFISFLPACQRPFEQDLIIVHEECPEQEALSVEVETPIEDTIDWNFYLANLYETDRKGRILDAPIMEHYLMAASDSVPVFFPAINASLKQALRRNLKLIDYAKSGNKTALKEATYRLLYADNEADDLSEHFNLIKSWGKDKRGNAKFTGYYSPFLNVKSVPDDKYCHPIYRKPPNWEGKLPSRKAIQEGALEKKGLTIAWTNDPIGLYYMHIQGSGFINYKDSDRLQLLKFAGSNGHKYRSIETLLARQDRYPIESISINGIRKFFRNYPHLMDSVLALNPSYTFFNKGPAQIIGAGGVPLTENYSVAVDTRYFPLGSLFLAAIPVYNDRGKITHHTFTYLVAQDKGGAIKGPGHLDIYCGVGLPGQKLAMHRHHYGRLWLLEPK